MEPDCITHHYAVPLWSICGCTKVFDNDCVTLFSAGFGYISPSMESKQVEKEEKQLLCTLFIGRLITSEAPFLKLFCVEEWVVVGIIILHCKTNRKYHSF